MSSANGDVIVTLLPQNTSLPWITPAQFRPELVPEELMAQGLTVCCSALFFQLYGCVVEYIFSLASNFHILMLRYVYKHLCNTVVYSTEDSTFIST